MKKFLFKIIIFLAIVVSFDLAYGEVCKHYRRNVKAGMTRLDNIAVYETEADILIFGSSRARRHYDTRIISDSLDMSAFNCGYNSMGIEFFYPRLRQILTRYTPKAIIYDITPLYDMMKAKGTVNILRLKPFFHDSIARTTIREMDYVEWIKLHSATYRYHGEMENYYADQSNKEKFVNGYAPLNGTLKIEVKPHGKMEEDQRKLRVLERFVKLCEQRDIKLFFVISPYFANDMGDQANSLRKISRKYHVPVFDHFNDSLYMSDSTLYWDASHFNAKGASMFTRQIMAEIKPYITASAS